MPNFYYHAIADVFSDPSVYFYTLVVCIIATSLTFHAIGVIEHIELGRLRKRLHPTRDTATGRFVKRG